MALESQTEQTCKRNDSTGSPFSSEHSAQAWGSGPSGQGFESPQPPCEGDPSQPHCTGEQVEALGQGRVMQVTRDSVHFLPSSLSQHRPPSACKSSCFYPSSQTDRAPRGRNNVFSTSKLPSASHSALWQQQIFRHWFWINGLKNLQEGKGNSVRGGPQRRLSAKELMLLSCDVGEDSWESLGLQGDPTSPSWRKSTLKIDWMDWCWSWSSSNLATWCEAPNHWKRPWCWERLRAEGEGGDRGWDGWMASLTQCTWVWASSAR